MHLSSFTNFLLGTLAANLAGATEISSRQSTPAIPKAPGLTYLYTANCTLAPPIAVGAGPHGNRIVIPITGGTFSGPRLKGTILNLGADWGLSDVNGTFSADTRYQLRTDDGANIFIRTSGPAQPSGHLALRIVFETALAGKYGWLNNIVAVGKLTTGAGYVSIDAWQLTTA